MKKILNTVWIKMRKEEMGILQLYLKSGAIKFFAAKTKREAKKQMRGWLLVNKIKG